MYEIFIQTRISSAHYLPGYPGPCRELHGHNWVIKASAQCDELNDLGMGVDFKFLKENLDEICRELDHIVLNEIDYFKEHSPTSENVARYLFEKLGARINDGRVRVSEIEVRETPGSGAIYRE
ncbi:MAG: 6-carboxytetrahydropterin synthase [Candidatus Euphemobacter frigidus]|nr:6-carboxytetrahydropterin synthase [Candidatus Euphemobacter frigidus]MDP8275842.1 6-carboxytetrahydropterin synthase [Candidatus Euphemobacter frigidus]